MKRLILAVGALAALCGSVAAQTDRYPARTVTIVAASAPGGAIDATARQVAAALQNAFGGKPVVVENHPGAQGLLGTAYVARAQPDGYTLLLGSNTGITGAPHLYKNVPYDPVRDLRAIACIATGPQILVVGADVPAGSLTELVALAKKQPKTFSYAFQGAAAQAAGALFARRAGVDLLPVPFKATAQAVTEVLAGRVSMIFLDARSAKPLVDAGKLKALGAAPSVRSLMFPNVATIAEQGYPGFSVYGWFGLFAPGNLSQDLTSALAAALHSGYFGQPAGEQVTTSQGLEPCPEGRDPGSFAKFIESDTAHWAELVDVAGIDKR